MKKRILLSISIPVYNFADQILDSLNRIRKIAKEVEKKFHIKTELIIVDDGSKDNTVDIITKAHEKHGDFRFIKLSRNFGGIYCHRACMTYSKGDIFINVAQDMQDPPELIPQMVEKYLEGYKFVYCSREKRVDPFLSKIFAALYYKIFFFLSDLKGFPTKGFDYCLISREIVDILLSSFDKSYTPQHIIWWTGFKGYEIKYNREKRSGGKSAWTFMAKVNLALETIVYSSTKLLRISSICGTIISFCAFIFGVKIVILTLLYGNKTPGWTSLACLISFLSGIIMIMLGIIGEYLRLIAEYVKQRPSFVIDKILEIKKNNLLN